MYCANHHNKILTSQAPKYAAPNDIGRWKHCPYNIILRVINPLTAFAAFTVRPGCATKFWADKESDFDVPL